MHLPLTAIAVATAAVASTILFPCSMLGMVTIPAIVALASAVIVTKRERENELYADLRAFCVCEEKDKKAILKNFLSKSDSKNTVEDKCCEHPEESLFQNIFSRYPSAIDRFNRLDIKLKQQTQTGNEQDINSLNDTSDSKN